MRTTITYQTDDGMRFNTLSEAATHEHKKRVSRICEDIINEFNAKNPDKRFWASNDHELILKVLAETSTFKYARRLRKSYLRGMRDIKNFQQRTE